MPEVRAILRNQSQAAIVVGVISGTSMNWPTFTIALKRLRINGMKALAFSAAPTGAPSFSLSTEMVSTSRAFVELHGDGDERI